MKLSSRSNVKFANECNENDDLSNDSLKNFYLVFWFTFVFRNQSCFNHNKIPKVDITTTFH